MPFQRSIDEIRQLFETFELPSQTLTQLPFCGHKPAELMRWLQQFKDAKPLSVALYQLLPSINQVVLSGEQRLAIASTLRMMVNQCMDEFMDEILTKTLDSKSITRIAAMINALQKYLCDCYLLAIYELLADRKSTSHASLGVAIYFATDSISHAIYQNYRLYTPIPREYWRKLHGLYSIAKTHQLAESSIYDDRLHYAPGMSVQQAYFRALILSCCHCNQLRPIDIFYIYRALEQWSSAMSLTANPGHGDIYTIDVLSDEGPFYSSQPSNSHSHPLYYLDLHALIDMLKAHDLHQHSAHHGNITEIPTHFKSSLIKHLLECWQETSTRRHSRRCSHTELEVCVGLDKARQVLLGESETNMHTIIATDSSKGGYCLRWPGAVSPSIKPGEMLLLKEHGSEHAWKVGNIRWAQRLNRYTYIGVKILGDHATASDISDSFKLKHPIILLDMDDQTTQSLIAPTGHFKLEDLLQYPDKSTPIELQEVLFHSAFITQYQLGNHDRPTQ